MMGKIVFGEIKGIKDGHKFEGRKEMMQGGFHRVWARGIDGNGKEGAAAIVLSGGYVDDEDLGDEIIYTGAGGNHNGEQIEDQTWANSGNAGLLTSKDQGLPVRVIRGHNHKSQFSPKAGYTYAGLYSVVDSWVEKSKSSPFKKICRFRLIKIDSPAEGESADDERKPKNSINDNPGNDIDHPTKEKKRKPVTVLRIVRETIRALAIKRLYNFECQVCKFTILTKGGRYAEGAHIRPLGKPHNGDDNTNNILCLCPNHHVMLDKGCFSIADDFLLIGGVKGQLIVHPQHKINKDNLKYHRSCHGFD